MASGRLFIPGWMPARDSNGDPIPNVVVSFYQNETDVLASVYADDALTVPLTNPVAANSSGRFPQIYASDAMTYSASVDAPYGPAGQPFTFDGLKASQAADIAAANLAQGAAKDAEAALAATKAAIDAATQVGGGAAALAGALAGADAANVVVAGKANVALDNVGGSDFGGKGFQVASRPVSAPLISRFANMIDLASDYGVIADGVTANQQTKINQAIAESLAASNLLRLRLPPGQIRTDAALSPITKSIILEGDTERATQLRPVGSFDALTLGGGLSRVSNAGLRNVGFNAADMTGGHCVVLDWTQDAILDNVLLADPWNGISIRQSGNVLLENVRGDGVRGDFGVKATGPGGTRNGEIDKIDVLIFLNCLMQGKYVPGGAVPTSRMIEIDGWVHTVGLWDTRLLSALSGLRTLNTFGLEQRLAPSIIRGWVETENTYEHGILLANANDVNLNTFSATSVVESGTEIGGAARDVVLWPSSQNNSKFGVYVAPGAKNIALYDPVIERNNQSNQSLAGVEDGSGALRVYGGRIGGGVSETQTYGLKGITGTKAFDVDLSGNVTAPTNGDIQAIRCLPNGAGRQPSVTVSVGASPFTYTVGPRNVSVALYGGSGVTATIDGVFQVKSSPGNFLAPAGSQVVVSYGTLPDMAVTPV